MNITRLSIDLAKDVFQLYGVDGKQKWLFSKIYGWMVAPQVYQAGDRALSASSPVF